MLGFVTRYGSSKGMVAVPNLSGQTNDQAVETIRNTGLTFKESTLRITQNQAFDKKVFNQNVVPGTLVDYESEISFSFDSYYETTANVTFGPTESYSSTPSASCSGTTLIRTTTFLNRKKVFFEGQDQGFYKEEAATSSSTSEQNSASCGYVAPPKVCPVQGPFYSTWSACDQTPRTYTGIRYRTVSGVRSDCSPYSYREQGNCCIPHTGTWSGWSGCCGASSRSRTDVIDADCNTRTVYESTCASQCSPTWKNTGTCRKGRQSQTRTCVWTTTNRTTGLRECTSYPQTRSVSCSVTGLTYV
jgi:hypothetical protein